MVRACYPGQFAIAGFLVSAPIGDTTVLLLFSLSLECLLALMLIRERQLRLTGMRKGVERVVTPFPLLARTAPHMRAHRVAVSHRFVTSRDTGSRWRNASREATS
jgi:hypothetical protein